jgi:geranylgeranyl reductase family protein
MMTDADVIISGAGPAGSLAAYALASRGYSVFILEKEHFPRYKVCGAGLTWKILSEIPFDLEPVLETTVRTFIFSKNFSEVFSRSAEQPLIGCTMRGTLDHYLLDRAVEAGARVLHEEKVLSLNEEIERVVVRTRRQDFTAKVVIGADGASGTVARMAGLRGQLMQGLAWEAEASAPAASVKAFSDTVFLDWGTFPGGYAWVFPKQDHFSIGVGGPAFLSKQMMGYYNDLLVYLQRTLGHLEVYSLRSWPIPVRTGGKRFHTGRIMAVGDAAGLTDPLTGEGIYYAVRSGRLAGDAAAAFLSGDAASLQPYSDAVNGELMAELHEAFRIRHLFNTAPSRIHRFVRDSDRAWGAFGKILRGERCYADVRNGFGKWKPLWGVACRVAKTISDRKERNFRIA